MPERMDSASKEKMLEALDMVSDLVEKSSMHPNDAIVKAAMTKKIPAGHVNLMVTAFNTGRANFHRKSASTVLDKAASVALANSDIVLEKLYPSREKSAAVKAKTTGISSDYAVPFSIKHKQGDLTKAASVPTPSVEPLQKAEDTASVRKEFHDMRMQKIALDNKAVEVESKKQKFIDLYKTACDTIRSNRPDNWSEIKANLEAGYGSGVKTLLKHIEAANQVVVKRANAKHYEPMNITKPVYREIVACMEALEHYKKARDEHHVMTNNAREKNQKESLLPMAKTAADDKSDKPSGGIFGKGKLEIGKNFADKFKSFGGLVQQRLSQPAVDSALSSAYDEDSTRRFVESLSAPDHEMELLSIRNKATLHDLMANDEVISQEDPAKVIGLYNDIQKLVPTLSQNPGVLRTVLRKAIAQGGMDTAEYHQLAETERFLHNRNAQPHPSTTTRTTPREIIKMSPSLLRAQIGGAKK